ncbi:MAG TPA: preprotein translocase subunit YajC [Nocardioides sp.]|uniref:preprotein translocase subunit YajC n=1 Tax=Nocardioides sp. TaxID=35761 RepID=UPI002E36E825|nr:preprotein translocase subunit YajC [Nocardioides sp.]HEX5086982.1 preprotein translocase subunit YajC [Nocardioides sp.]
MQSVSPVLFILAIALLLWLLLVRPQARRQRELRHMQSTLEVGDEVMLTSGVFGTVRGLEDDVAQVEIAEGVTIKVARGAVGRMVHEVAAPSDAAEVDNGEVSEEN